MFPQRQPYYCTRHCGNGGRDIYRMSLVKGQRLSQFGNKPKMTNELIYAALTKTYYKAG